MIMRRVQRDIVIILRFIEQENRALPFTFGRLKGFTVTGSKNGTWQPVHRKAVYLQRVYAPIPSQGLGGRLWCRQMPILILS